MKLWIARDKNGMLTLFDGKPFVKDKHFVCDDLISAIILEVDMFPEVTFENSPQEVELKLI